MSKRNKAIKDFLFQETKEDTLVSVNDIMKNMNFDVPQIEPKTIDKKSKIKTPIKIAILLTSYILVFFMAFFITRTPEEDDILDTLKINLEYKLYSSYYFMSEKVKVYYTFDEVKKNYYICNYTNDDITLKYNDEMVLLKNNEKFLIATFTTDNINKIEFDLIYKDEIRHGVIG